MNEETPIYGISFGGVPVTEESSSTSRLDDLSRRLAALEKKLKSSATIVTVDYVKDVWDLRRENSQLRARIAELQAICDDEKRGEDARLGKMLRNMPVNSELYRSKSGGYTLRVASRMGISGLEFGPYVEPEHALDIAGVRP